MKGAALIVFALLIDGIQAAISAAVLVMSLFPGTFFGAIAGCAAGGKIAGDIGCAVGSFILGLLGSIPVINGLLTVASAPLGAMLSFIISICLSLTLGAALVMLLVFSGMFYPKYLFTGGMAEIMPGFSLIPSWTAIVILSILKKNKEVSLAAAKNTETTPIEAPSAPNIVRPVDGIQAIA